MVVKGLYVWSAYLAHIAVRKERHQMAAQIPLVNVAAAWGKRTPHVALDREFDLSAEPLLSKVVEGNGGLRLANCVELAHQELRADLLGHAFGELSVGPDSLLSALPLMVNDHPPCAPKEAHLHAHITGPPGHSLHRPPCETRCKLVRKPLGYRRRRDHPRLQEEEEVRGAHKRNGPDLDHRQLAVADQSSHETRGEARCRSDLVNSKGDTVQGGQREAPRRCEGPEFRDAVNDRLCHTSIPRFVLPGKGCGSPSAHRISHSAGESKTGC